MSTRVTDQSIQTKRARTSTQAIDQSIQTNCDIATCADNILTCTKTCSTTHWTTTTARTELAHRHPLSRTLSTNPHTVTYMLTLTHMLTPTLGIFACIGMVMGRRWPRSYRATVIWQWHDMTKGCKNVHRRNRRLQFSNDGWWFLQHNLWSGISNYGRYFDIKDGRQQGEHSNFRILQFAHADQYVVNNSKQLFHCRPFDKMNSWLP